MPGDSTTFYFGAVNGGIWKTTDGGAVPSLAQASLPDVYELEVDGQPLADKSLREARIRERFGITVVAVRRSSGELLINPPAETVINTGDRIRVFGLRDQIDNFIPLRSQHEAATATQPMKAAE